MERYCSEEASNGQMLSPRAKNQYNQGVTTITTRTIGVCPRGRVATKHLAVADLRENAGRRSLPCAGQRVSADKLQWNSATINSALYALLGFAAPSITRSIAAIAVAEINGFWRQKPRNVIPILTSLTTSGNREGSGLSVIEEPNHAPIGAMRNGIGSSEERRGPSSGFSFCSWRRTSYNLFKGSKNEWRRIDGRLLRSVLRDRWSQQWNTIRRHMIKCPAQDRWEALRSVLRGRWSQQWDTIRQLFLVLFWGAVPSRTVGICVLS